MSNPYDTKLRNIAKEVAKELDMDSFLREGVYCHLSGPSFETPFESRFLRLVGCDAVGMSTAPEVVVAKHCGMTVLGVWRERERERERERVPLMVYTALNKSNCEARPLN